MGPKDPEFPMNNCMSIDVVQSSLLLAEANHLTGPRVL